MRAADVDGDLLPSRGLRGAKLAHSLRVDKNGNKQQTPPLVSHAGTAPSEHRVSKPRGKLQEAADAQQRDTTQAQSARLDLKHAALPHEPADLRKAHDGVHLVGARCGARRAARHGG